MTLDEPLIEAAFIRRLNRFAAEVDIDGRIGAAHLANPGRMKELLVPGTRCRVRKAANPNRKLPYDFVMIKYGRVNVSLQSFLANDLVAEALAGRKIPSLSQWSVTRREVTYGRSRVDFLLGNHRNEEMTLEVKSCTYVIKRHGFFPDAPTTRGARHVREAIHRVKNGGKAGILFCVQRADCDVVSPNAETDPDFTAALRDAHKAGVFMSAVRCLVSPKRIVVSDEIPVAP